MDPVPAERGRCLQKVPSLVPGAAVTLTADVVVVDDGGGAWGTAVQQSLCLAVKRPDFNPQHCGKNINKGMRT